MIALRVVRVHIFVVDCGIIVVVSMGSVMLIVLLIEIRHAFSHFTVLPIEHHQLVQLLVFSANSIRLLEEFFVVCPRVDINRLQVVEGYLGLAEKLTVQAQELRYNWIYILLFVLSKFNHLLVALSVFHLKSNFCLS